MYSFENLKSKADRGMPIAKYKGMEVYPISKEEYKRDFDSLRKDIFFVIYDNDSLMVKDNKMFGHLKPNGHIETFVRTDMEYIKEVPAETMVFKTTGTGINTKIAETSIDTKIKLENVSVDTLLSQACDMSWIDEVFKN